MTVVVVMAIMMRTRTIMMSRVDGRDRQWYVCETILNTVRMNIILWTQIDALQ